jgi:hypothetical protein
MANKILLKRSATPNAVPTAAQLEYGELAINYNVADRKIFFKDSANNIVTLATADDTLIRLDNLLAATSTNTINNGNYAQVWNWALTGSNVTAFTIGENTAATNPSTLFAVKTLTGSDADPFVVSIGSNQLIRVKASGEIDIVGRPSSGAAGDIIIAAGDSTGGAGGDLSLQGGDGVTGGVVEIIGGQGSNTAGNVNIVAGANTGSNAGGTLTLASGTSTSGNGGAISVTTAGGVAGGAMTFTTGNGSTGNGGNVTFTTGNSTSGNAGNFTINLGSGGGSQGIFNVVQNNNSRLTVDADGQVGVNIANPTEALHVSGNIRLTGSVKFADGDQTGSTLGGLSNVAAAVDTAPNLSVLQRVSGQWVATTKTTLLELDDLTDINIGTPTTGQVLYYSGTDWINQTLVIANISGLQTALNGKLSLSGGTMTGPLILSGAPSDPNEATTKTYVDNAVATTQTNLTNHINDQALHLTASQNTFLDNFDYVDVNSASTGDVIQWNGTQWVASPPVTNLDGLSDVIITTPTASQVLRYNGSNWVNAALVAADISNFNTAVTTQVNSLLGSVVQAYDADLAALAAIATTGIYVITGSGTSVTRDILGTAGRVVVTNGSGVSGNPTIDLAGVTNSNTGTFQKVDVDAYGRVTGHIPVVQADITTLVDSVYVNASGDTMSGILNMGSNRITGVANATTGTDAVSRDYGDTRYLQLSGGTMTGFLTLNADPTAALHAATKAYVDAVAQGLKVKAAVRAATTGNITLSGLQTVDGVSLVAGDRVLVRAQTDQTENGIYVVSAGTWTRSTDADTGAKLVSAFVFVESGTIYADVGFVQTTDSPITLGTSPIVWTQFSGAGTYVAGAGLTLTGNIFDVGTASPSRIVVNANDIDLATTGVTPGSYNYITVDAYGRATTAVNRTLTAGSSKVTITNGNFSGDPTIDVVESNILINNLGGGPLSIANGGTGQTTASAAAQTFLGTVLTAKGDLLTRTNTNSVALPVGPNGYILKANSATTTGLEWSDTIDGGNF